MMGVWLVVVILWPRLYRQNQSKSLEFSRSPDSDWIKYQTYLNNVESLYMYYITEKHYLCSIIECVLSVIIIYLNTSTPLFSSHFLSKTQLKWEFWWEFWQNKCVLGAAACAAFGQTAKNSNEMAVMAWWTASISQQPGICPPPPDQILIYIDVLRNIYAYYLCFMCIFCVVRDRNGSQPRPNSNQWLDVLLKAHIHPHQSHHSCWNEDTNLSR